MKRIKTQFKSSLITLTFVCMLLVSVTEVIAQKNGAVSGRVVCEGTNDYLPGANVMLKETTFGAATDRSGIYRISNIPPGTYTLVVRYIGYTEKSIEITIGDQGYSLSCKASDGNGIS